MSIKLSCPTNQTQIVIDLMYKDLKEVKSIINSNHYNCRVFLLDEYDKQTESFDNIHDWCNPTIHLLAKGNTVLRAVSHPE